MITCLNIEHTYVTGGKFIQPIHVLDASDCQCSKLRNGRGVMNGSDNLPMKLVSIGVGQRDGIVNREMSLMKGTCIDKRTIKLRQKVVEHDIADSEIDVTSRFGER